MAPVSMTLKWGRKQLSFHADNEESMKDLQRRVLEQTQVPIDRQRLIVEKGKVLQEGADLRELLKEGGVLTLVGSGEELSNNKNNNNSSSNGSNSNSNSVSSGMVWVYCSLLALQFGLQPILNKAFINYRPEDLRPAKASVVIGTELLKIFISFFAEPGLLSIARSTTTLSESLRLVCVPACMYAIQNVLIQNGLGLIDPMTFNLLNQTKTISVALFLWILMGKAQSGVQVLALGLLLAAGER